jgi:integrase
MLALYTGQRKGDVHKIGWKVIDADGFLTVTQSKTCKKLRIPLPPALLDKLSQLERKGFAAIDRRDGHPLTSSGFKRIWRRQQEKHGFKGLQFHGLRRNAVNALLEAGYSIPEVSAITGQSFEMISHCAQEVNQERMAQSAMNKWQTNSKIFNCRGKRC